MVGAVDTSFFTVNVIGSLVGEFKIVVAAAAVRHFGLGKIVA